MPRLAPARAIGDCIRIATRTETHSTVYMSEGDIAFGYTRCMHGSAFGYIPRERQRDSYLCLIQLVGKLCCEWLAALASTLNLQDRDAPPTRTRFSHRCHSASTRDVVLDHALEAEFSGLLLNCRQRIQGNRVARLEGVTVDEVVSVCKHRPSSIANSYENL